MNIENSVNQIVEGIISDIKTQVEAQVVEVIRTQVAAAVAKIDIVELFNASFSSSIKNRTFTFPDASIPGQAIDPTDWTISGSNIQGGIIKNFGSSGIDDKALTCQLSIFDSVTVVENNLVTKALTVKGTVTVEGDLNVTGTVSEDSALFKNVVRASSDAVKADPTVFQTYSNLVFKQIKDSGLDLNQIKLNGQDVVVGQDLGSNIVNSNLQTVGQLKELQVAGETLLSGGALYTTNQRVGVNTIEPSAALSVWDQEIEIGIGKQSSGTAVIGAPRNQTLVVSSNGKNNITLTPDGSTTVNKIHIGSMSFTVGTVPPSNNQPIGSVVFNSNPSLGGPLGWISLGEARWANFGIID
jgi:hypothetical protein